LYLGENHFAYDQLSLNQNIDYWLSIHNVTFNKTIRDQSIRYLFGELNLNKKFYQLSFGQKKKLQLLLLMLVNKPIWILDDPFNGLDNDTIIKITTLLSKKVENKGTIIIASHQNLTIPHRTYELT
jgi:heme exporter protein A